MSAGACANLYPLPGQTGTTDFVFVPDGQRYAFVRRTEFKNLAVGASLSSMTLYARPPEWQAVRTLAFGDQVAAQSLVGPVYYDNPWGFAGELRTD